MSETVKRKNIIWVFGDQHRGQALSCHGDPNVSTPHIDRMVHEGVDFTHAVGGYPLCCPFRGSMLTGLYPHKCVPGHEHRMPPEQPTVAHAFRDAGYHTAYFGKWHVDGFKEREGRAAFHIVPPERRGGFDVWVGYENNNSQYDCWVHGGEGDDAFHYRLPGYETDCLTDMLVDYVEDVATARNQGRNDPFFAALSVQPPHNPYVAPPQFMQRHRPGNIKLRPNVPEEVTWVAEEARLRLAGYYAQIENLDYNVGRIRDALDRTGLADDTYIMFFADHGDLHGSHGQFHKTSPLHESLSVPFVLCGGGSVYDHGRGCHPVPVNHVDIAPTSLGLCGIEVPGAMEGTDWSNYYIKGKTASAEQPESAYVQSVIPTMHGDSVDRAWRGVFTRDGWKYVCLEGQPWYLFNLNDDPYERANLAHNTRYKVERKRLHDMLAGWIDRTDDHFVLPDV